MKQSFLNLSLVILFSSTQLFSKPLVLSPKELASPPPRIIRTCCSFGSEVGIIVIPFVTITETTFPANLGPHNYLGNPNEGNGIIYTARGGFIDMGHLRDQADWTAYLYTLILTNKANGLWEQHLGYEGGTKTLNVHITPETDSSDILILAARIAYDLSIWHEIATWFGTKYVPLLPEKFSSFSVEDPYSNLLGVTLGMKAIQSNLPYEKAMTALISSTLNTLGAVQTQEETNAAMEAVLDQWWTRDKHLPNDKMMLERELDVSSKVCPMLVPEWGKETNSPCTLDVPKKTQSGKPLSDLYQLEFKLNYKFPYKKMFPEETGRIITQENFDTLIHRVEKEMDADNIHPEEVKTEGLSKKPRKQHIPKPRQRNLSNILLTTDFNFI